MTITTSVLKQVADLPGLPITDLKKKWRQLFENEPPPYNKSFLVRRLAYRLQELAHGVLTSDMQKRLKDLAKCDGNPPRNKKKHLQGDRPITGTRLMREWKGVEHWITVLEEGFDYQGRKFGSLSAVARTITGTRWNGKIFFGLKKSGG